MIHGIDMNCLDAVCNKINDLLCRVGNARLFYRIRIVSKFS